MTEPENKKQKTEEKSALTALKALNASASSTEVTTEVTTDVTTDVSTATGRRSCPG